MDTSEGPDRIGKGSQNCRWLLRAARFAGIIKIINLSAVDLVAEFARRGPWITQFVINGAATGGDYQVVDDDGSNSFLSVFLTSVLFSRSDRLKVVTASPLLGTQASNELSPSKHAPPTSKGRNSFVHY
jgi:hypothetical protein